MHHVAIMNARWKLIPKILSGEKTIESRWYVTRRAPWNTVSVGDTVFFKDSGKPVTAQATVEKVLQFENLTQKDITSIIKKYGGSPGICFSNPEKGTSWALGKKYCVLVFLTKAKPVKPFGIDKTGFGNANAWLTVKNISTIRE